jgi:hypothetical protein
VLTLIALTGVTLAAGRGFSLLSISAAAFALGMGGTGCCSVRTQLTARMAMTLAAASGFSLDRLCAEHGPTGQALALSGLSTYHARPRTRST